MAVTNIDLCFVGVTILFSEILLNKSDSLVFISSSEPVITYSSIVLIELS